MVRRSPGELIPCAWCGRPRCAVAHRLRRTGWHSFVEAARPELLPRAVFNGAPQTPEGIEAGMYSAVARAERYQSTPFTRSSSKHRGAGHRPLQADPPSALHSEGYAKP